MWEQCSAIRIVAVTAVIGLLITASPRSRRHFAIATKAAAARTSSTPAPGPQFGDVIGRLPLRFEPAQEANLGARFTSRGPGYAVAISDTGIALSLSRKNRSKAFRLNFMGASPCAKMIGLDEQPGKSNYYIGNDPARWREAVPAYAKVKCNDIYPGIDLVYYGRQRELEYDLVVSPTADPTAIRMAVSEKTAGLSSASTSPRIDSHGDLVLGAGAEETGHLSGLGGWRPNPGGGRRVRAQSAG
jgi:hypothetical protein